MADETTGTEGTAQPAATGEGTQGAPEISGFQERINQLTAKAGDATREAAEAKAALAASMERIARLEGVVSAQAPRPQGTQEPELDFSEFGEAAEPLKKLVGGITNKFQKQLAAQQASFDTQLRAHQVAALAASVPDLPPQVRARAEDLAQGWAAKGLPVIADDALNFAIGEAIRKGTYRPAAGTAVPQGRVMGGSPQGATITGHVAGGGGGGVTRTAAPPANFENLSPAQQQAWIDKNGVDFDL
jgi:hypothetical protein